MKAATEDAIRDWYEPKGHCEQSFRTFMTRVRRLEPEYGELESIYAKDRLVGMIEHFAYSKVDRDAEAPNRTRIEPNPHKKTYFESLKSCMYDMRRTLKQFQEFMDSSTG